MADPEVPNLDVAAATAYEELFVPALFEAWAERVADAAHLREGDRVLDVACGTGVLARAAAKRVAPGGRVTGLDPSDGMLAVAARRAPALTWRKGVAESLPFPDASLDAVVSQFGLMFFADRAGALREMLRVLRPGGRLAVAVWAALETCPAYVAFIALLARLFGPEQADTLRAPFALGDPAALIALLREAGARAPMLATPPGQARFPSLRAWVEADARGWLQLDDARVERLFAAAQRELAAYVAADGSVSFAMPAHIVVASKS